LLNFALIEILKYCYFLNMFCSILQILKCRYGRYVKEQED